MFSSDSARATAWMSYGACLGEDPELFFPIAATGTPRDQMTAAKAVCGRCSVQGQCLSYAVSTAQDGIWGGTTGDERRALRVRWSGDLLPLRAIGLVPGRVPNERSQVVVSTPRPMRTSGGTVTTTLTAYPFEAADLLALARLDDDGAPPAREEPVTRPGRSTLGRSATLNRNGAPRAGQEQNTEHQRT
jgi:WhiB family transcriptional regulator, redox-sensing transcriptional regulator